MMTEENEKMRKQMQIVCIICVWHWNSKREPWIPIYTDVWQSADGNESRAYLCVHEFKETAKMPARMGIKDGIGYAIFLQKQQIYQEKRKYVSGI